MKVQDREAMASIRFKRGSGLAAAILVAGIGFALAGCAQSMSEFAQAASPGAPQSGPLMLEPASVGSIGNGVARPAVLVEETTVPAQKKTVAASEAPPLPPATADASTDAGGYPNINRVPEQPKGKLLTAEEKAKVVAELEALARAQQSPGARDKKAAKCAAETVKPADRIKGETGGGQC